MNPLSLYFCLFGGNMGGEGPGKPRCSLGLEGEAVAKVVGTLGELGGVDEEAEGGLEVRADLLDEAEADLAGGVELGLDGGGGVELVLGADLEEDPVGGADGGLGGDGDVLGDVVGVATDKLGELLVRVDGNTIVLLGVADGEGVVGKGGLGGVHSHLGTGDDALVANDGVNLGLGALEDVGGGGEDEGGALVGQAELDLLLGGGGVEGGVDLDLEAVNNVGGLDLDAEVVVGGVGVGEDEAGVGVRQLGLEVTLDDSILVVALKAGGELLQHGRTLRIRKSSEIAKRTTYNFTGSGGLDLELGLAKVVLLGQEVLDGLSNVTELWGSHGCLCCRDRMNIKKNRWNFIFYFYFWTSQQFLVSPAAHFLSPSWTHAAVMSRPGG